MGHYYTAEVTGLEAIMTMIPKPTERRAAEVAGAEAIVTTIPEPMWCHAYGMCGAFRFCVAAPPFRCPVSIDGQDLGPLVSAWV
jgi:hypothetical protein